MCNRTITTNKVEKRRSVLLVTEWHDPRIEVGIAKCAKENQWHLYLEPVYTGVLPWGWTGDGCIVMAANRPMAVFVDSLDVPVVDLTHQQPDFKFARIHSDDCDLGRLAAEYFKKLGFKNFACYSKNQLAVAHDRISGFAGYLSTGGHACRQLVAKTRAHKPKDRWLRQKKWLAEELKKLPKPVAVFCIDDCMAVDVIEAATDASVRVPEDVAVLGVGNMETACECSVVPISSIDIEPERLGHQAGELLQRLMDGETVLEHTFFVDHGGITERRSTDTLAVNDPHAAKAVRFILDNYQRNIGVNDIANASVISRRKLNYLIGKELNTSPAALLESIRLNKALVLLEETDYTIAHIAELCGFGLSLRLHRTFNRKYKTTPGKYRRQYSNA